MGTAAGRQAWAAATIQRRGDSGLPYPEGIVRDAAQANDRVRPEPVAAVRFGVGGPGLQHAMPSIARQAIAKQSAERGQQTLNVRLTYRGGTGPLNILIPSRDITA